MLNPEKILGALLRGGPRGGSFGKMGAGSVGLGLLGMAMAAAEHYMGRTGPSGPPSTVPPAAPPHPSPTGSPDMPQSPPPPPSPGGSTPAPAEDEAVLLIRSMIAAANADGTIDEKERGRILEKLDDFHLTPEENSFILRELLSPCGLQAILEKVRGPETARRVYAVSLMAIEVDTDAERDYLLKLAQGLALDDDTRQEIHRDLGIDPI